MITQYEPFDGVSVLPPLLYVYILKYTCVSKCGKGLFSQAFAYEKEELSLCYYTTRMIYEDAMRKWISS